MKIRFKTQWQNILTTAREITALLLVAMLASGCLPQMPEEGLVEGTPLLLGTTMFSLEELGYQQKEFFIKGTAHSYASTEPLSSDGKWTVASDETADFKTRIVVYTPIDPDKFNGTVVIEWLNVSGGTEASSGWIMAHTELARSGYAWVGVSAQKAGIDGDGIKILDVSAALKQVNPFRYSTLEHPGDKFSYDIYRQAAKAVLQPGSFSPLGDLLAERSIAMGESQSADYLLTYVNAVAPLDNLFDAYFIHSRVHGSQPLAPEPGTTRLDFNLRDSVQVRDDLTVPVLMLQTETDMTVLGAYPDRQDDSAFFRLWEIAGTAHADRYVGNLGLFDRGDNPDVAGVEETNYAIPILVDCGKPVNSGPQHFLVKAAINTLNNWLLTGVAPLEADRFVFDDSTGELLRDGYGNVLGGIRTPYVDVPIATLSGEGQTDNEFCSIYGTTTLFDAETLASLYPDHETYVSAVFNSVDEAVANGFLVAADGELIKTWAQGSSIGM